MCLVTKQKRVKVLKEDLVVYKLLEERNNELSAWMYCFIYEIGVLYVQEMKVDNDSDSYHDDEVSEAYNFTQAEFQTATMDMTHVHEGFHFATSENRLIDYEAVLCECIVPKGSRVYFDKTGLGVANQIKIVRVL